MIRLTISICALLLFAAQVRAQVPDEAAPPRGLAEALALAQAAYAASDWLALRDALTAAEELSPGHPLVLYHLARAEGLTGDAGGALRALHDLVRSGGSERDLAADTAFALLRGHPGFEEVLRRLRDAAAPVVRGDTAFLLPDPDLIPEGIAHDPRSDAFFVGSLHRGHILRVTRDGPAEVFAADSVAEGDTRRRQVVGLRVDPGRGVLWAATLVVDSAAPPFRRGPGGWASLSAFDLRTGRRVASYAAPDSTRPHLLNDIALAPDGDLYVTDSEGDALYRLEAGGRTLQLVYGDSPRFVYPNGVTVDAERGRIYVAHTAGISVLPLDDEPPVGAPPLLELEGPGSGIDGLYLCGAGLLAIQSLLDSQRVVHLSLANEGLAATEARVLERNHPAHRVATTGVIVGDDLYYIASSQLGRLLPDGAVQPAAGEPVPSVVLRLPLEGACAGARAHLR